jgi:acyl-[acyl carrier protein]--UDP-N-acetylglucosamine O-acyltransferase
MKNLTYEAYLADPLAAHAQIQRAASRGRAAAVHQYVIAPLARFCGQLSAVRGVRLQLDPRR